MYSTLTSTTGTAGAENETLSETVSAADGLYTFDGLGRMTGLTKDGKTIAYTYNGDGQRVSKTVDGVTTQYVWDGDYIVMEKTGNSTTVYKRANRLFANEKDGTKTFYRYNARGDVVQLTNASYAVTKTYRYDAFGNEQNIDANDTNPFRYCGEYFDTETGYIYLRARYYDPTIGRFISEDPIRDGLNWYVYCGNNPVMFVDPTGLATLLETLLYQRANPESMKELYNADDDIYRRNLCDATDRWISEISTNNAISIAEYSDMIVVLSYIRVSGDGADDIINGETYESLIYQGIRRGWNGKFENKDVFVVFPKRNSSVKVGQQTLHITVKDSLGISNYSWRGGDYRKGSITMYMGDSRTESQYSKWDFSITAAHEFGHALGIGDLYNDNKIEDKFPSIMNSQWKVNGKAQAIDFAMMMSARNGRTMIAFSSNQDLIEKYVK